uniref:Uncharacterized protein n=1 Tax=Melanopsichium pennsylvanicum 4 TaxID=1398559 RepID=A0A077R2K5_9BASI|nr:uncharacterized protein BN887_06261 [Melanopsichium pennsylvanicum 4]
MQLTNAFVVLALLTTAVTFAAPLPQAGGWNSVKALGKVRNLFGKSKGESSGSGRLEDYLAKGSKIDPENPEYVIRDENYATGHGSAASSRHSSPDRDTITYSSSENSPSGAGSSAHAHYEPANSARGNSAWDDYNGIINRPPQTIPQAVNDHFVGIRFDPSPSLPPQGVHYANSEPGVFPPQGVHYANSEPGLFA